MLEKDQTKRITIKEILNSRIMKKVVASIIEKHKPADQNGRQTREDVVGLKNQTEELSRLYNAYCEEVKVVEEVKVDEESSLKLPAPAAVEQSMSAESVSPTNSTPMFDEMPSVNSSDSCDAEDKGMMAEMSTVNMEVLENDSEEERGEEHYTLVGSSSRKAFGAEEATPPLQNSLSATTLTIQSVSSDLTKSVISSVLFAAREGGGKRYNRPSSPRLQFVKQGSNLSVISTTSTDNNVGRGKAEGRAGREGEEVAIEEVASIPLTPVAAKHLMQALEYGEEMQGEVKIDS